ncbi:PE family protein [Mycobacterium tuberculosis variant bovis]|nr:PE family protein [Mycobacterium tuberculosis variant bovis]
MLARRCSGRHGLAILTFWRCRMSFLIASPEALAATATYLTGIGSAINAANAVAAAPTTEILAAGTDEVSTAISALFGAHAQAYQALSAHVAAFHDQFVHTLTAGAGDATAGDDNLGVAAVTAAADQSGGSVAGTGGNGGLLLGFNGTNGLP